MAITIFAGERPYGYLRTELKTRHAGHVYTAEWSSPRLKGQLGFCAEAYEPRATRAPGAVPPS